MADEATLRVAEIFFSLQGESTFAGQPCAFVRLSGCDVGCRWCDTRYAAESPGTEMRLETIVERLLGYGVPLVEITGGEPLMQAHTPALARRLVDAGRTIMVETSGTRDITPLPSPIVRIVDVKAPSSGATEKMDWHNLKRLRPTDELKFVLADENDYRFAKDWILRERLDERCPLLMSPVANRLPPPDLASWILRDRLPVRLQLQLHRILWPDTHQGV